jgi:hypothetical protein
MTPTAYRFLADAVLALHFAFVAFVVLGLVLVLIGGACGWRWVRNRVFRSGHAAAIAIVVAQAWIGALCPLTTLEMWLRGRAGEATYAGSFIAHWLSAALYYQAPAWLFTAAYTAFAALVIAAWVRVPPVRSCREPRLRAR